MAPSAELSPSRRVGAELAIAWLGLFGLFTVVALFAYTVSHDRQEINQASEDRARIEAILLADHAARLFEAADLALWTVIDETREMDPRKIAAARRIHDRFRRLAQQLPYVEAFWYHDATGRLLLSSLAFPTPEQSAVGKDFFEYLGNPSTPDIHVGATVADTFRLSHRMKNDRGEFRGVVSLSIEASYFRDIYAKLGLPEGSVVTVLDARTLTPLVQHPGGKEIRPVVHDLPHLRTMIGARPVEGRFRSISPIDGVDRVYAYRQVPGFPLYVKVSIPLNTVSREWSELIRMRLGTAMGAVAALSILIWLGFRQTRQQRRFQESLARRVSDRTAQLEQAVQEVHHRVNNNLQIVNTLLTAQLREVADPAARQALSEGANRVNTIGLVHRAMYDAGSVANLPFGDYLRTLARRAQDLYSLDASVEVEGDNPQLPLAVAVPLALIVHELLAAKSPDEQKIRIALLKDGRSWRLLISGISSAALSGMGAQIVPLLAATLDASLADDENGVTVTWPEA